MASSDLISNASLVSTLTGDAVVSVATGVGQPQKNIKLSDLASVVAGMLGVTDYSLFRQYTWSSGDLDNAPHGIVNVQCWENTSSFSNMPISDRNANAIVYTFRNKYENSSILSAFQFFLHGYKNGICYFRCYSNNVWSSWKVIS